MKNNSIKSHLISYVVKSFALTLLSLVLFFIAENYLIKSDSLLVESKKLSISAREQAARIVPGILVREEYGSIELQLQKIKTDESLTSVEFIPIKDFNKNSLSKCKSTSEGQYSCFEIWQARLILYTAVSVAGETLGFLIKKSDIIVSNGSSKSVILLLLITITGIYVYLIVSILVFIEKKVRRPLLNLNDSLHPVLSGGSSRPIQLDSLTEISSVNTQIVDLVKGFEDKKAAAVMNDISMQVAHDIRSPLAALNMVVGTVHNMPEQTRLIIRNATNRINDIANVLLQKGKSHRNGHAITAITEYTNSTSPVMLSAALDSMLSEKRVQFRELMGIEISLDTSHGYGLFVNIDIVGFNRCLSNLINNSVEAIKENGKVKVSLFEKNGQAQVLVSDTGKGIPKSLLAQLGEKGVSHGKSESASSGSGLGLYQARQFIESCQGQLLIESAEGAGTTITLSIPTIKAPQWFLEKLELKESLIVSLDDDSTIHQIWNDRLANLPRPQGFGLSHLCFSSLEKFETWYLENSSPFQLFIDFEFLNQASTGIEVIRKLNLNRQATLVTSRFDDPNIQASAQDLRIKILPKGLAATVPMAIGKAGELADAGDGSITSISNADSAVDLILIDDDVDIIHTMWAMQAEAFGKRVKCFASGKEFIAFSDKCAKETPIYLDFDLGQSESGLEVAEKLYNLGFQKIYLSTGFDKSEFKKPNYVVDIVGKEFPV